MSDKVFVDGFIVKKPHEKAPDFIKATVSIKVADFSAWAKEHASKGWVNITIKEARSGNFYAELDAWKPKEEKPTKSLKDDLEDSVPF